jgi:hypothetical protein
MIVVDSNFILAGRSPLAPPTLFTFPLYRISSLFI